MIMTNRVIVPILAGLAMITSLSAQADPISINGKWVIGNGDGILVIRGAEWFHPKFGTASIKYGTGSSDIEVFYNKDPGASCGYRVTSVAGGDVLVLEAANPSQSPDYCPSGKFSRADK